jgi:hypothetical protein
MKLYRNTTLIKRQETLGRRFSLAGLAILFVCLLVSFVPTWYPPTGPRPDGLQGFLFDYWSWLSFGALFIGFFCASVGSYYINRYARRRWPGSRFLERPDEVLERNMKGFDDRYAFFAQSLPAAYALAGPHGLTLFALRSDKGRVVVDGEKWREPFSFGRLFTFFAREGVGNPARDLEEQKGRMRDLLAKANGAPAGEGGAASLAEIPMAGAALFLNQQARLELTNPVIPVLRADQVKDYVRARAKEVKLTTASQRALLEHLVQSAVYQEVITE